MEALKVRPEENVRPEEQGLAESPVQHTAERCWRGFEGGHWQRAIDVRDFIVRNRHALRGRRILPRRAISRAPRRSGRSCGRISRRSGARACWTSTRRRRPRCSPTSPAGSTATTRSSSACRPTVRSAARFSRPAGCAWSKPASRPRASKPTRRCTRPSHTIARPTTTACSTPIRRRS